MNAAKTPTANVPPPPPQQEMHLISDAVKLIKNQERQRRRDMREAGVEIGSPVPGTMEPTIPYATGPTVSDFAADFRFMGPFGPNMLEPAEEWEVD